MGSQSVALAPKEESVLAVQRIQQSQTDDNKPRKGRQIRTTQLIAINRIP